ncbi:MAG: hypothetical protein JWQ35_1980 [Bacteriovoracaceae bacterium]|nr:hypothetical protein [Bacteriovoracaceae bacterium]
MRLWLLGTVLVLSGCGSTLDSSSSSSLNKSIATETLSLDRGTTSFQAVDKSIDENTKVTLENTDFKSPRRIERDLNPSALSVGTPDEDLVTLATKQAKDLNPNLELQFLNISRGSVFAYVTFQQTFHQLEVQGSRLVLRLNGEGNWVTMSSTLISNELLNKLPTEEHSKISSADYFAMPHHVLEEKSVVYPRRDDAGVMQVHLARRFAVFSLDEHQELYVWVDEQTKKAIGAYNPATAMDTIQVRGTILANSPDDKSPIDVFFPNVTAILDKGKKIISDDMGNFDKTLLGAAGAKIVLENEYLSVYNNHKATREELVDSTATNAVQLTSGTALEDRNVFYWIMVARKVLTEKLKYNALNYRLGAYTNYGDHYDNAFFMPLTKTLSFGSGGKIFKNTALGRDVVIHEFGHAVTHAIYGTVQNYEFNSMNEAFSDYFAASVTNDPTIGEGVIKYYEGRKYLRTVDNQFIYPKDFSGVRFHDDGQMFSGSLWDLRQKLGADYVDQLVHEARLAQAKTIREFFKELLIIEKNRGDRNPWTTTNNIDEIWKSFQSHGLMSDTSFTKAPPEDLTISWKRQQQGCMWFGVEK